MESGTPTTTRKKHQACADTVSDYSEDPSPTPPNDDQPTLPLRAPATEEGENRDEDEEGDGEMPEEEDTTGVELIAATANKSRKAGKIAKKKTASTSRGTVAKEEVIPKPTPRTLASTRPPRKNAGQRPHDAVRTGRPGSKEDKARSTNKATTASNKTAKKMTRRSAKTDAEMLKAAKKATVKDSKDAAPSDDARADDAATTDEEIGASGADAQDVDNTNAEDEVSRDDDRATAAAAAVTTVTSTSDMTTAIVNVLHHCVTVADTFVSYTRARNEESEADAANARFDTALKRNRSSSESARKKLRGD